MPTTFRMNLLITYNETSQNAYSSLLRKHLMIFERPKSMEKAATLTYPLPYPFLCEYCRRRQRQGGSSVEERVVCGLPLTFIPGYTSRSVKRAIELHYHLIDTRESLQNNKKRRFYRRKNVNGVSTSRDTKYPHTVTRDFAHHNFTKVPN